MSSPPISCASLSKAYDGRRVVDDVTFDVSAGSITGFVGANGAGKTTTLRMLVGLVTPTSGRALISGRQFRDLAAPRREVGAVIDGPGAHPNHTARRHLEIVASASDISRRRVPEVLEMVDLTEHASRRVGGFSLGMRQRLALATALLGDPPVLLLDEPVNGLDPPGILWVRQLLRRLAQEGRAVLVSSHMLAELAEIADRVAIIDRGRLVALTDLDELLRGRGGAVEVRCAHAERAVQALSEAGATAELDGDLIRTSGLTAEQVGAIVQGAGAGPVFWLHERPASFEDVYFELAAANGSADVPAHGVAR